MARRKTLLDAMALALPTSGLTAHFASVHRGYARVLSDAELPAAIVRHGDETVDRDHVFRRDEYSLREMEVEVEIVMKHSSGLADAMDDYAELVEQSILHSETATRYMEDIAPGGVTEIEFDDEAEKPTASMVVRFRVIYSHWPDDPSTDPVADPYSQT